jgi:chromosome segregation ATPase
MREGSAVIEQPWIERLTWGFLIALASAAAAWFVASFRKVDRTIYEKDRESLHNQLQAMEARIERDFAEKLSDLRQRQSKFDQRFDELGNRFDVLRDQMAQLNGSLREIAAEMRARKQ